MEADPRGPAAAVAAAGHAGPGRHDAARAEEAVTELYEAHALGLIRLAHIMLGDRSSAEDVVQEAFCGLYRRWSHLADPARAVPYVRSSVLNGCRSVLSPDGSKLALDLRRSVQVITLASGARRAWRWPGGGWVGNFKPSGQVFSWTTDGQMLAFQQWGGRFNNTPHVRVLDTTAPGSSLLASKLAVTWPQSGLQTLNVTGNTLMTPDGSTIVAPTMTLTGKARYVTALEITEFSARTGKIVRSLDRFRLGGSAPDQNVLWTSPSGATLIVYDPRGKAHSVVPGVLSGNRFTALPRAPLTNEIAW